MTTSEKPTIFYYYHPTGKEEEGLDWGWKWADVHELEDPWQKFRLIEGAGQVLNYTVTLQPHPVMGLRMIIDVME